MIVPNEGDESWQTKSDASTITACACRTGPAKQRASSALLQAGINPLGVSAFPHGARKSQLDLIAGDSGVLAKATKSAGLKLSKKKSGFLIQGEDRPGATAEITSKLAEA
jgi:hypothetical protein